MKILLGIFILIPFTTFSQVGTIELESVEDLEILEQFEKEKDMQEKIEPQLSKDEKYLQQKIEEEVSIEEDILEELGIDESFLAEESEEKENEPIEEVFVEYEEEFKEEKKLEETITKEQINPERNLRPKFENLIKKDEIAVDEQLDFNLEGEKSLEFHQNYIKDFKAETAPKSIDKIIYAQEEALARRFKNWEKEALKVQIVDIAASPLYVGQIYKGTKIINTHTNEVFYTQKTITVRAHSKVDSGDFKFLRSKNGDLTFKTYYKNIANISEVANLYRPPYKFKRLQKKVKKEIIDKELPYKLNLYLHTGLNSPNYTNELLDDPDSIAAMVRAELRFTTNQKNYFETGLSIMYETISGELTSGGSYKINSLSLGANFVTPKLLGDFYFLIQPSLSLASNLELNRTEESYELDFAENAILLAIERELIFSPYGNYIFGFNYQRKWYQADSDGIILSSDNTANHDDSFAISLGFTL